MHYSDGEEARLGDTVSIAGMHWGRVVACLDRLEYSSAYPADEWAYLATGILVDTGFGGLVHYSQAGDEQILLIVRDGTPQGMAD